MILNKSQAEVVAQAMCALNNVCCISGDLMLSDGLRVRWLKGVSVQDGLSGPREEYADQNAFFQAYNLE